MHSKLSALDAISHGLGESSVRHLDDEHLDMQSTKRGTNRPTSDFLDHSRGFEHHLEVVVGRFDSNILAE
jgi:hypothetical protein